jgi:NADH-quinone oxidoreductase subunit A
VDAQLAQYIPVLILLVLAAGVSGGMLWLSHLLGKVGRRSPIKDIAYECGMVPVGTGSTRLAVKFYLVAMLFILFDIEVVFLYPWAVVFRDLLRDAATANLIFWAMISFVGVLFAGYLYALRKGAFDWRESPRREPPAAPGVPN